MAVPGRGEPKGGRRDVRIIVPTRLRAVRMMLCLLGCQRAKRARELLTMSKHEKDAANVVSLLDEEIARLAPSRATVLLRGGSPEARAAVARALHERSGRRDSQFIVVDCGGIDGEAVERRLFGGPMAAPIGRGVADEAERGTLYVADIDGLPPLLQPRFLSFLDRDRGLRVVASTAGDLAADVREGRFRGDLGERLLLVQIRVPNLRTGGH
jgi:DNA-binding NtrC family response regulator